MNQAEQLSKFALRLTKLQKDLRRCGQADIADLLAPAAMEIVRKGLAAYDEEYCQKQVQP